MSVVLVSSTLVFLVPRSAKSVIFAWGEYAGALGQQKKKEFDSFYSSDFWLLEGFILSCISVVVLRIHQLKRVYSFLCVLFCVFRLCNRHVNNKQECFVSTCSD